MGVEDKMEVDDGAGQEESAPAGSRGELQQRGRRQRGREARGTEREDA